MIVKHKILLNFEIKDFDYEVYEEYSKQIIISLIKRDIEIGQEEEMCKNVFSISKNITDNVNLVLLKDWTKTIISSIETLFFMMSEKDSIIEHFKKLKKSDKKLKNKYEKNK